MSLMQQNSASTNTSAERLASVEMALEALRNVIRNNPGENFIYVSIFFVFILLKVFSFLTIIIPRTNIQNIETWSVIFLMRFSKFHRFSFTSNAARNSEGGVASNSCILLLFILEIFSNVLKMTVRFLLILSLHRQQMRFSMNDVVTSLKNFDLIK